MTAGRKRSFDEEVALEAAMQVFWRKGYSGASLTDLTQGMGINKPSMYSAFGNKEALFIRAAERYMARRAGTVLKYLDVSELSLRQRLEKTMQLIVTQQCDPDTPLGCLVVTSQGEVAGGDLPEKASELLDKMGNQTKQAFARVIRSAPEAQEKGLSERADVLALSLATTLRGTASMARAGVPYAELEPVIDCSLSGIGL
ncbi:TetR/AcrR family transcriptional regulator [Ferrimonas marina]|uniref:Transcriptional regulator, TetR family n=1 Tax=Ferrimonas marina TaxID=299255 RepID=A0A1M5MPP9_9GAMM|nr:TetR/AcrR family transcriptional regulator [Ferrimonas marina]SHG79271.1 transcriptional regulator, TetR family [Ferrimonas marina]